MASPCELIVLGVICEKPQALLDDSACECWRTEAYFSDYGVEDCRSFGSVGDVLRQGDPG
jgi:hypothetical protein